MRRVKVPKINLISNNILNFKLASNDFNGTIEQETYPYATSHMTKDDKSFLATDSLLDFY
jgi:hypothetical protein